jgi:hypothetical protein
MPRKQSGSPLPIESITTYRAEAMASRCHRLINVHASYTPSPTFHIPMYPSRRCPRCPSAPSPLPHGTQDSFLSPHSDVNGVWQS